MDTNTAKKRLQELEAQYMNSLNGANDTANRSNNFVDELQAKINQNGQTYKTEIEDVNNKKHRYVNAFEDFLPEARKEVPNDPAYMFSMLGREQMRRGSEYDTARDILGMKQGSVADLVNAYGRTAQGEAQKQAQAVDMIRQQMAMAEQAYARAFQEQQANRSYGLSGGAKTDQEAKQKIADKRAADETIFATYLAKYKTDPEKQVMLNKAFYADPSNPSLQAAENLMKALDADPNINGTTGGNTTTTPRVPGGWANNDTRLHKFLAPDKNRARLTSAVNKFKSLWD